MLGHLTKNVYHLILYLRVLKYCYLLRGAERVLAYHEVLREIYKLGFTVAGERMKKCWNVGIKSQAGNAAKL